MINISRRISTRLASGIAFTGAVAAMSFAGAGMASAVQIASSPLAPGAGTCTQVQYAAYQVRTDDTATNQGAKFKILRNGVVVQNTANRQQNWQTEMRTAFGNFRGAGYYSVCAQNTGTTNTNVTLQLRTDAEF
jgi:hypothetical protein